MKKSKFFNIKHIHFIGIGGISMSGLAKLMVNFGYTVSGSDAHESEITTNLQQMGVKIYYNHSEKNIDKTVELVVYSGAISLKNPELIYAISKNIIALERSDFLGEVTKLYDNVISISGTHGKTTTTALIGEVFLKAGLNPTIHLGGEVVGGYDNFRIGGQTFFITEACEYKKSLEKMYSHTSIITNIEKDHMDCYENIDDIYNSFNIYLKNTRKKAIVTSDKEALRHLKHDKIITCGEDGLYYVDNLTKNEFNCYSFDLFKRNEKIRRFTLSIPGLYNVVNAMYAIVCALEFNIDIKKIQFALKTFKGIKRRNEKLGMFKKIPVYADYAHHPTEIEKSLENFKSIYGSVVCVYQPHTYSRTRALMTEFSQCFSSCKYLVMYPTYPAREEYDELADARAMFESVKLDEKNKFYTNDLDELGERLKKLSLRKIDAIVVLGAGDLYYNISKPIKIK